MAKRDRHVTYLFYGDMENPHTKQAPRFDLVPHENGSGSLVAVQQMNPDGTPVMVTVTSHNLTCKRAYMTKADESNVAKSMSEYPWSQGTMTLISEKEAIKIWGALRVKTLKQFKLGTVWDQHEKNKFKDPAGWSGGIGRKRNKG